MIERAGSPPPHGFPSQPVLEVARCLEQFVGELRHQVSDEQLWRVRARLKNGAVIDHDRDAIAFSCAFLLINYWKAAYALACALPGPVRRVTDLGSGSGAMALATLTYLYDLGPAAPQQVHLRLVDRSATQLEVAERAIDHVRKELKGPEAEITYDVCDVRDFDPVAEEDRADLVTACHLFTENPDDIDRIGDVAAAATAAHGTTLIIEPHDDVVWPALRASAPRLALPAREGHAFIAPGDWMASEPKDPRQWKLRWLAMEHPRHPYLARLVRAYLDCWRSGSADALNQVFLPEARYRYNPFEQPLSGRREIEQYWREHVLPQRRRDIRLERVAYTDHHAFLEWAASFVRDELRYELQGMMVIEADPQRERVASLHEYYRASKSPERSS